jgi:integrative and conjugative element protein (TIGR02256 family)
MSTSDLAPSTWMTRHPDWYQLERRALERAYPEFWVDDNLLNASQLVYYGELVVRASGGATRYPVALGYPEATPYEHPVVRPLQALPARPDTASHHGSIEVLPKFFDYRHQMANAALCLFQRDARNSPDIVSGVDALRRAGRWFLGLLNGHWPPDSADAELETHFRPATSVLFGSAFYEGMPDPGRDMRGEVTLVPDILRPTHTSAEVMFPYIATALVVEVNGVVQMIDARAGLERLYPWIRSDAWNPASVALPTELTPLQQMHGIERGYWWYLPREPRPFRDGAGFLRELAEGRFPSPPPDIAAAWNELSSRLGWDLQTATHHIVGFCYPGRHGGIDWLFFIVHRPDNRRPDGATLLIKSEADKRSGFETAELFLLYGHSVQPNILSLRNTGVIAPLVAEKTVALIGLGALGSKVAELLAQAGIGALRLCDVDAMTTGNAARHVAGVSSFGDSKVLAVMRRVLDINPHLRFDGGAILRDSATRSPEILAKFMAPADLVIVTTADESVEAFINEVALQTGTPVLYGRAVRRGSMGRVFIVRPESGDACKACLAHYAHRSRDGQATPADWVDIPEPDDDPILHECGRPVIPASAVDLSFVAGTIARVALDHLSRDASCSPAGGPAPNHWIWTREAATEIDRRLENVLSTMVGSVPADPMCPTCRKSDVREVVLSASAQAAIVAESEGSLCLETGGILIGSLDPDTGRVAVVRATGPGPAAERSSTRFDRDVAFVQDQLDRASAELGAEGAYVGEWHSHLVPVPFPSATDVESLAGIASAANYATNCPIVLIAGLDAAGGKVTAIRSWAFPAGTAARSVLLRIEGQS